jgi:hypothetical protein
MQKRLTECLFVLGLGVLLCALAGQQGYAAQFTSPTAGYTLTYPDSWNARPNGRDVAVQNFQETDVPEGGFVVPSGVTIFINSFPPYDHPYLPKGFDEYDALDQSTRGYTTISRTARSSGLPARVTYLLESANLRIVETIIHQGGKIFHLMMWCNADDPQVSAYDQILNDVIASISLVGPTPSISVLTPTPAASAPTP